MSGADGQDPGTVVRKAAGTVKHHEMVTAPSLRDQEEGHATGLQQELS